MSGEGLPASACLSTKCRPKFEAMMLWFGCNVYDSPNVYGFCPQDGNGGRCSGPLRGGPVEFLRSLRACFYKALWDPDLSGSVCFLWAFVSTHPPAVIHCPF